MNRQDAKNAKKINILCRLNLGVRVLPVLAATSEKASVESKLDYELQKMSEQTCIPIKTPFGYLKGRDTIYLEASNLSFYPAELKLGGIINGSNATDNPTGLDLTFSFTFHQFLALKIVELDSWNWKSASCFDEIINSEWIATLGGKVTDKHKHYLVQTYDDVFEVVCLSVDIELTSIN